MIYLRSIIFYLGEALSTIPFTIISALVFFAPPRIRSRVIAGWAVFVVWWLKVCCGLRHEVIGLENVPNTPCVFACNHQSTWETIATQTFLPPLAWVLKKELLKIPFFGWGLWMTRPIAIDRTDRKNALEQVVDQGKDKIKENRYVLVFPEGTRTPMGVDRQYKKGGARLAIEADVPVVPIAHNAGRFWSSTSFWIQPGLITCKIGPALDHRGKDDIALTEEIRTWIKAQDVQKTSSQLHLQTTFMNTDPSQNSETVSASAETTAMQIDFNTKVPAFVDLLPEQVKPYWEIMQTYPIVEALSIFALFYVVAFVLRTYLIMVLKRLTKHTSTNVDDEIIESLRKPIFAVVMWVGLVIATRSVGYVEGAAAYITPFALTMVVLIMTRTALAISSLVISALSKDPVRFKSVDIRTEPLLVIVSKILICVISAYSVLMIWGINPVGLLASAGVVGIAVGFAAKDTLANLFSGMFILADRPYKLGDYINLSSGERGKVTHIGIRSTRILTRNDIEVTIPNGVIGNEKVINESGGSHINMRIRVPVECGYDSDLELVEQVLMQVALDEPEVCGYPAPRVRFRSFNNSGISVQLTGWIDEPEIRGRVIHSLVKSIHKAFNENSISFPYPRRDITIKRED